MKRDSVDTQQQINEALNTFNSTQGITNDEEQHYEALKPKMLHMER